MNKKSAESMSPYEKESFKARQIPHSHIWIVATELYVFIYLILQYAKHMFLQLG